MSVSLLENVSTLTTACIKHVSVLTIVDGCIKHVNALTTVDCSVFGEQVTALITVDWCVCVSCGKFQCSDHCGWVCLHLWWNISVLLQLWMGVCVSLVEHVSCLTIEDGCFKHGYVCVSFGTCHCSYHCGWVCLCLCWNISML